MRWLGACVVLAAASACASADAKTPIALVPLVTPTAPRPAVVPAPPETEPPVVVAPQPATPPATPPSRPGGSTTRPDRPETTPPKPAAEEPPAAVNPPTPQTLQTGGNMADAIARTQRVIDAAKRDLSKVKRNQLNANAQAQYDTVLGFIAQAENALKVKNLVFAQQLADKAATMAGLLVR